MSDEKNTQQLLNVVLLRHLQPIIDMLRSATLDCPDDVFAGEGIEVREHLYHAIVGMDIWLSKEPEHYPFDKIADPLSSQLLQVAPEIISRRYLLAYIGKLEARVAELPTDAGGLLNIRELGGRELTFLDQCLMQIRHVQHHLGAVDEILRRKDRPPVRWAGYGSQPG